jgi:predicted neutral ceramidase superfamily lipid hydrolase
MPTPAMLDPYRGELNAIPRPSHPLATWTALLIGIVAAGLFVAGVLAVYDYNVPAIEGPLVLVLVAIFGFAVLLNIAVATVRSLRRPAR